ncbi:MAG: hypothetical protein U0168_10615 [Nannocystaceae bacterium]
MITGVALLVVAARRTRGSGKATTPPRRATRLRPGPGGFALAF